MKNFIQNIILTIIFFLFVSPIAIILRALGLDLLDQKRNKQKTTYWKIKKKSNIDMKKQY